MYPQKSFNLGRYSCLETKKNVVQIDLRTSKSSEKYLCALQNTSVYRDFACMFMALSEKKLQKFWKKKIR